MIEESLVVNDSAGLHARSARMVVDEADQFESDIVLVNDDTQASAKSILEVMMLAAHSGTELTMKVRGEDEQEASDALKSLFERGFETS